MARFDGIRLEMVKLTRRTLSLSLNIAVSCTLVALMVLCSGTGMRVRAAGAQDVVIDQMTFLEEDITVVLSALAQLTDDLSVVADSSVKGTVTQTLKNMKLMDAIDLIIKTSGYDWRLKGNVVVVATPDRIASVFDAVEIAVIPVNYRPAAEITSMLDLVIPPERIREDERTRSIIISGTSAEIEVAKALIARLDKPIRQVMVQARVEEIATSKLKDLGIKWEEPTIQLQRNPIGQVIGASVDVLPKLGLLQDEGYSRTVASPELMVEDRATGRILLGDRIPVKMVTTEPDGTRIETWEYFEAGVRLEVTPEIGMDDEITLRLKPEISAVETFTEDNLPWLKTREVETVVRMRSGETAVVGGLLQTQELENMYKIPLLGDIPIMGELFKRTDKDITQTELLIFITVMIVDDSYRTTVRSNGETAVGQ